VKKSHFTRLHKKLSKKENVRFLLLNGKNHNPNYTPNALNYLTDFFKTLAEKNKKGALNTPESKAELIASRDWWKMTEQDETVWSEIFATLSE
jgi:hypothetical protein